MNPVVTIIMPCWNGAATIGQSIESVLNQGYENFELIIIDDGSTDNSRHIVQNYSDRDPRVRPIVNASGCKGVWSARNSGLEVATGKFICFLDCDDYLLKDSLVLRVNALMSNDFDVVHGDYLRKFDNGVEKNKVAEAVVTYEDMLKGNKIGNLTGMYNASRLGVFYQKNIRHEDYVMWSEIIGAAGRSVNCSGGMPLAVYRVSGGSLSGNKLKSFVWHWNSLRSGLNVGLFHSIKFQSHYMFSSVYQRLSELFVKS